MDLEGLHVRVWVWDPNVGEQHGIMAERLQADVELRLRENGIKVFTAPDGGCCPPPPALTVEISFLREPVVSEFAVEVDIAYRANVLLAREPTEPFPATIWRGSLFLNLSGNKPGQNESMLQEYVGRHLDRFIKDYIAANAKKPVEHLTGLIEDLPETNKPTDKHNT
jgi:hypothetical protein